MIPKVIHYCWFGHGKKPALAERCIASWRKFFPDYEIREWNEENYDVHQIPYISQAYSAKKYAFVSDYVRFDVLHKYGGLYFDTDVEVIKPLTDILSQGPFMGLEGDVNFNRSGHMVYTGTVNPGLGLAAMPGLGLYKDVLELYKTLSFVNDDGSLNLTTVVTYVTRLLLRKGLKFSTGVTDFQGIKIYPSEYFNPKKPNGKIFLTSNTCTIHHFAASWHSPRQRIVHWVVKHVGLFPGRLVGLCLRNPLTVPGRIIKFLKGQG